MADSSEVQKELLQESELFWIVAITLHYSITILQFITTNVFQENFFWLQSVANRETCQYFTDEHNTFQFVWYVKADWIEKHFEGKNDLNLNWSGIENYYIFSDVIANFMHF